VHDPPTVLHPAGVRVWFLGMRFEAGTGGFLAAWPMRYSAVPLAFLRYMVVSRPGYQVHARGWEHRRRVRRRRSRPLAGTTL
jgi:hypothetical protein